MTPIRGHISRNQFNRMLKFLHHSLDDDWISKTGEFGETDPSGSQSFSMSNFVDDAYLRRENY